ncbi:MAG: AMP-dependent synthetase/ligase [Thermodesulfobacteriota bacterium]
MAYAYQTENSQVGLFFIQAGRFGGDVFMRAKDADGLPCGQWTDITWSAAAQAARHAGAGLMEMGIQKTDCIGLFAHNQPRWIMADLAIQGTGAVGVPIYPTSTDSQLAFILNDCGAKAVIAGDMELLAQVLRVKPEIPTLQFVVCLSPLASAPDGGSLDFEGLLRKGAAAPPALEAFDQRRKALTKEDIAAIIYTSGTTGNPKGVMLSQGNFCAQTDVLMSTPILQKIIERGIRLNSLCFLPLCHVMGRANDYHLQMAIGTTIHFAESIQKVQENLLEVKPQVLFSVPRLYEKFHEGIKRHAEKLKGRDKKTFDWALKVGDKAADHMIAGEPLPPALGVQFALANALVFDKVRKVIGFDRLVVAGSGGAALQRDITKFFRSMNITITEGYGLTETTSAVSSNAPVFVEPLPDKWIYRKALAWLIDVLILTQGSGQCPYKSFKNILKATVVSKKILPHFIIKPGFVGRPCKDTDIRIAEDGEVLVKGPQVFSRANGYFKQPAKTAEVFTEDGYFKTGDIGEIDADGFLKITDRKKELIVTSGGKNIAPNPIEMALISDLYIDQCCVVGDGRNFITALIVPQFDLLRELARKKGIAFNRNDDLVQLPEVVRHFDETIEKVNRGLARYEQIKKYRLLPRVFSEESGELTPTLKMKRRVIHQNYRDEIESLYRA